MPYPIIKYTDIFYSSVDALSEERSEGILPSVGEKIAVYRFRANGADPSAYVALIWDRGGSNETILASTKGDIDIVLDPENSHYQFTGDGVAMLQICIINNNLSASPIIGGNVEVIGI